MTANTSRTEEELGCDAGERDLLEGFLEYHRQVVSGKHSESCAESRRIAAGFALDDTVPHDRLGPVSLRWIYVHMIREHARHIGHADVLREQIDGATGD